MCVFKQARKRPFSSSTEDTGSVSARDKSAKRSGMILSTGFDAAGVWRHLQVS